MSVTDSLSAIDGQIRKQTGGDEGSGLYTLLSTLATQFMGVPRSPPPAPPPEENAENESAESTQNTGV